MLFPRAHMQAVEIGEMAVPAIGFGTWDLRGDVGRRAVEIALGAGYRHIDTAQMYGNEAQVGAAIRESGMARENLFLTTKIWRTRLVHDEVLKSVDESLDRLGVDYVDLLLIHWPDPAVPLEETLSAMQKAREQGRIRNIGVSNFPPSLLHRALEIAPEIVCNQVEYHPMLDQSAMLELIRAVGLFLTAYCPLGQGHLLKNRRLRRIARRHGKTVSQVILRWHLQQPGVVPIPRSSKPDHIRENLDVLGFQLSEDEMRRIHRLARNRRFVDPGFVTDWKS